MGLAISNALGDRSLRVENADELSHVASRLRANDKGIETLDLSNKQIGAEGAEEALEPLAKNRFLKELNLSYNNLGGLGKRGNVLPSQGNLGIKFIADALSKNSTLTKLNVAGNSLGTVGTIQLARALGNNQTLQELCLYNNYVDDAAMSEVCKALQQNHSLTKLNLDYNDITDKGAQMLLHMFEKNSTLVELSLRENNDISEMWIKEMEVYLQRNHESYCRLVRLKEEEERKEKERLEAEERIRAEREAELVEQRKAVEKEYREMEALKRREQEEADRIREEQQRNQYRKAALKEQKQMAQQEHIRNLVDLAYAWRGTLRGGLRRGREWRSGFTTVSDTSYGMRDTFTPPEDEVKRRLRACWCEPTDQTVMYAGTLHYHCLYEPDPGDSFGDDQPKKYGGCQCTAHRCRSAPMAEVQKERNRDTLFSSQSHNARRNKA